MDYKTVLTQMNKGTVAPLYVCYGTETYLISEFIKQLTDRLIEPEHRALAVSRIDLSEAPLDALLDEAETLPFMVPHKLVTGTNALFLTGAKDNSKVVHKVDRLLAYIEDPAPFTVVILTVHAEKLDMRKKIVKALNDAKVLVPCGMLSAGDLLRWVESEARSAGFEFAPGVAELLISYAGTGLQQLSVEIAKCAQYLGHGGVLNSHTLEQLVTRSTEQSVFLLVEYVAQLKLDQALAVLDELLRRREEPIKIVALLARQFRIMLQVKELSQQGHSQQQAASQLGLHPYAVKVAAGQAVRFDLARLASVLAQLADLDYEMKTGRVEKVLGLELFLLKLAV